ncbi:MAG: hypothetical protein SGPRY_005843, partial [Prymnesium sp.]
MGWWPCKDRYRSAPELHELRSDLLGRREEVLAAIALQARVRACLARRRTYTLRSLTVRDLNSGAQMTILQANRAIEQANERKLSSHSPRASVSLVSGFSGTGMPPGCETLPSQQPGCDGMTSKSEELGCAARACQLQEMECHREHSKPLQLDCDRVCSHAEEQGIKSRGSEDVVLRVNEGEMEAVKGTMEIWGAGEEVGDEAGRDAMDAFAKEVVGEVGIWDVPCSMNETDMEKAAEHMNEADNEADNEVIEAEAWVSEDALMLDDAGTEVESSGVEMETIDESAGGSNKHAERNAVAAVREIVAEAETGAVGEDWREEDAAKENEALTENKMAGMDTEEAVDVVKDGRELMGEVEWEAVWVARVVEYTLRMTAVESQLTATEMESGKAVAVVEAEQEAVVEVGRPGVETHRATVGVPLSEEDRLKLSEAEAEAEKFGMDIEGSVEKIAIEAKREAVVEGESELVEGVAMEVEEPERERAAQGDREEVGGDVSEKLQRLNVVETEVKAAVVGEAVAVAVRETAVQAQRESLGEIERVVMAEAGMEAEEAERRLVAEDETEALRNGRREQEAVWVNTAEIEVLMPVIEMEDAAVEAESEVLQSERELCAELGSQVVGEAVIEEEKLGENEAGLIMSEPVEAFRMVEESAIQKAERELVEDDSCLVAKAESRADSDAVIKSVSKGDASRVKDAETAGMELEEAVWVAAEALLKQPEAEFAEAERKLLMEAERGAEMELVSDAEALTKIEAETEKPGMEMEEAEGTGMEHGEQEAIESDRELVSQAENKAVREAMSEEGIFLRGHEAETEVLMPGMNEGTNVVQGEMRKPERYVVEDKREIRLPSMVALSPPAEHGASSRISFKSIRELHLHFPGVELMLCKQALVDSGGDQARAAEFLLQASIPQSSVPQISAKDQMESQLAAGCRVRTKAGDTGTTRYVGPICGREGLWIGVELDTTIGMNDGTSNGVRYFECEPNRGLFTRACNLNIVGPKTDVHDGQTFQGADTTGVDH